MLDPERFINEIRGCGFTFFSGVPCSFLKYLINSAIGSCDYVMAVNEGDAVAICAGAYLAGRKSVVLMQNSGLTNALSPLTSLNHTYRIPVLGLVSLRGEVNIPDEPQHELMGKITGNLLDLIGINWEYLSVKPHEAYNQIKVAAAYIQKGESFFFIVRKDTFLTYPAPVQENQKRKIRKKILKSKGDEFPNRIEILRILKTYKDSNTALLTTTGYSSRELFEIDNTKNNFLMVGSMGCIGSISLGLALVKPDKNFIAIDGDGALLMRLGSLATIGYYQPKNLLHILLDNNSYESTGGQKSVSDNINFIDIASACGYTDSIYVHDLNELLKCVSDWKGNKELTFIHMKISTGTKENLGRPSVLPTQITQQFMEFLMTKA
jgi:phosphonopyruvate decarboxylase